MRREVRENKGRVSRENEGPRSKEEIRGGEVFEMGGEMRVREAGGYKGRGIIGM